MTMYLPALLGVLTMLFRAARADDSSTYPEWVTNDYNCVIGCLQGFNSSMTTIPNTDLENQSYQCISTNCDSAVAAANKYQASYIIQLFYQTGSIYESSSEPSGSAWFATDYATSTMYSDSQATDSATDTDWSDDSSTDTDSSGGSGGGAQATTSAVSMGGITTATYSTSKSGSASVSASRASGTIANADQTASSSGALPSWDISTTLYQFVEMSMGLVCLVGSTGLFVF